MKPIVFICLLFAGVLTSCGSAKYATVPVWVNYAARLTFNPDTACILIINRLAFDSTKITNKKKIGVLRSGAYSAIAAAQKQLMQLKGVRVISLADSVPFTVNTDSIKQLAANHKAGYVLTLDNFAADIVLNGIDGVGADRLAYYNTKATVQFTLYEANGLYFKKLKGEADDPQSESSYQGFFAELIVHPTIKRNGAAISYSARNAALNALKDYLPFSITNDRPLYNQGDELHAAVLQIQAGRFDMAFKVLNPLVDSADVQLASRAAYNLAVIYEAQGDMEEALELAKQSDQKQQNAFATILIAELNKE